jgi:hypothetical protein
MSRRRSAMNALTSWRRGLALSVALGAALVGSVTVLGGHGESPPPSLTACLSTTSGKLGEAAVGDAPAAPCKEQEVVVHLGGGDVTGVVAGSGLSGGGTGGEVELSVDPGSIVTGVTAGFGLDGGGSGGDVTLAVDPAVIQRRVVTDCGSGSIAKINQDGTAACVQPAQGGLVATLDAGVVVASGIQDTEECDEGQNESGDAGPFTSTAGPLQLSEGVYQAVPRGFRWRINKSFEWGDEEVFYAGQVQAVLGGTRFRREVNSRGLIVDGDRDGACSRSESPARARCSRSPPTRGRARARRSEARSGS